MQRHWQIKNPHPQLQSRLSNALNIHPIISQLLINRGITEIKEAENFMSAGIETIADPFLMKDMDKAVARIRKAQRNKERVLVFGDYDVDGVTSSALLNHVLSGMGIDVLHHIPHRVEDGYGLNHSIGLRARKENVSLLICIDCGITAKEEVAALNRLGIEVIVIDHHEPNPARMPEAVAIINPKQPGCAYPFKEFASVGLAAKLIQALTGQVPEEVLELVAIGTIADIVPLHGENRVFVKHGMPKILKTKNIGLRALLESARVSVPKISSQHIGFILGPRLNAAGRMDSAHGSLDLLLAKDGKEALALAQKLEEHNTRRQKTQRDIVEEALDIVEQEVNFKDQKVIVLSKEGWHKGVLGIVASKLTDRYYRPSVVISVKDGVGTASARSIDGFHLYEALSRCSDCLEEFGGHEGAAGLTIRAENIESFREMINEVAHKTMETRDMVPTLSVDCEVPLSSVDLDFTEIVSSLEPFGEGNSTPVFATRRLQVKGYPALLGKDTLKFWVSDGKVSISAVGFGMAKYKPMIKPGAEIDLAYEVIIDDWNKSPEPQLKIKDIRLSD